MLSSFYFSGSFFDSFKYCLLINSSGIWSDVSDTEMKDHRCPPSTQQDYIIEQAGSLTNKQITT